VYVTSRERFHGVYACEITWDSPSVRHGSAAVLRLLAWDSYDHITQEIVVEQDHPSRI
jgi:hypothetical protein